MNNIIKIDIETARTDSGVSGPYQHHGLAQYISIRDDAKLAAVVRGLELVADDLGYAACVVSDDSLGRRLATLAGYGPAATRSSASGDPRAWCDAS